MKIKIGGRETEIPMELSHVIEVPDDGTPATDDLSAKPTGPADPAREFIQKASFSSGSTTLTDDALHKMIFADADVRDAEPTVIPLRKGVPDWSWSTPVSNEGLTKRATTRAQFELQLARFFGNHPEELTEARALVDQTLADEKLAIEAAA